MKRVVISAFLYFFVLFHINAQEKSSKGYIIINEQDTLYGSINEGTDLQLTSFISFKEADQASEVKYSASELRGFGFDYGRRFKSFVIKGNPTTPDEYVFAKRIADGKISVFTRAVKQNHPPDFILINNLTQDTVHLTEPEKKTLMKDGKEYSSTSNAHSRNIQFIKGNPKMEYLPKIRYTEGAIKKNIVSFNKKSKIDYPVYVYKPKMTYVNHVSVGLPFTGNHYNVERAFRISYYQNRYSHEETTSLSLIRGISYQYFEDNSEIIHLISIIPIGFNLQLTSGSLIPYVYAGPGLGLFIDTYDYIVDNENKGSKNEFHLLPTINVGVGLKIKLKSSAISLEVTPSLILYGWYANIGYSF